ncbi:hypothetical protein HDU67_000963 [Dinochytrium kinnereticum]|nr:hypothetical protein HDU67_000963 [Dinochytrium kinnereticum]
MIDAYISASDATGDYPQLAGSLYLDSAGAGLPPKPVVDRFAREITTSLYANPHSGTAASASNKRIERVRSRILSQCNVDPTEFSVVFVQNATAGMKLVAESFRWDGKLFWYLTDSHTSVVGMREYPLRGYSLDGLCIPLSDGEVQSVGMDEVEEYLAKEENVTSSNHQNPHPISNGVVGNESADAIFAFTAQSNFNGFEYPLSWVNRFKAISEHRRKWAVLVDASSFGFMDLGKHPADILILSFYKMIGFPTGVAALIMRNDFARTLRKPYFGGGTVDAVEPSTSWHQLRPNISHRFEDGTIPFLDIIAVDHGLDWMEEKGGWQAMKDRSKALASVSRRMMAGLRYPQSQDGGEGLPLCTLYMGGVGETRGCAETHGPVIAFNLIRPDGLPLAGTELSRLAELHGIHLRAGCFCNLGACSYHLELPKGSIRSNAEAGARICGDTVDILDGRHVTALRVSFGPMNDMADVTRWIDFLDFFFAKSGPRALAFPSTVGIEGEIASLSDIYVYPIKSCGGVAVDDWPIVESGLLYDRIFMVVDQEEKPVTQKRYPMMADIRVIRLDPVEEVLVISAPSMPPLTLSLKKEIAGPSFTAHVCRQTVTATPHTSQTSSSWFSTFLKTPCDLITKWDSPKSPSESSTTAFQNESQMLVISSTSFDALCDNAREIGAGEFGIERFRANMVIGSPMGGGELEPFLEEEWGTGKIWVGGQVFQVGDVTGF